MSLLRYGILSLPSQRCVSSVPHGGLTARATPCRFYMLFCSSLVKHQCECCTGDCCEAYTVRVVNHDESGNKLHWKWSAYRCAMRKLTVRRWGDLFDGTHSEVSHATERRSKMVRNFVRFRHDAVCMIVLFPIGVWWCGMRDRQNAAFFYYRRDFKVNRLRPTDTPSN